MGRRNKIQEICVVTSLWKVHTVVLLYLILNVCMTKQIRNVAKICIGYEKTLNFKVWRAFQLEL